MQPCLLHQCDVYEDKLHNCCQHILTAHDKGLEIHCVSIAYQIDGPESIRMIEGFRLVRMFNKIKVETKERILI